MFARSLLLAVAVLLASVSTSSASIEFHFEATGKGENGINNVGAKVDVYINNIDKCMTIVVTNTLATLEHGDVLTGFILDFKPDLSGATMASANNPQLHDPDNNEIWEFGGKIQGNKYWQLASDSTPLGGTWKMLTSSDGGNIYGDFGVATNGGNGLFSSGGILGNVDYGLVGPSTFEADSDGRDFSPPNGLNNDNGQSPLVQSSVVFKFGFEGTIADGQIVGGVAMFGTGGHVIEFDDPGSNDDNNPVPEPATIAIWSMIGFGAVGGAAWRRRRRKAA